MTDRCKDPATDTWPVRSKRGMVLLRPHGFGDAGPEEIPATPRWGEAACRGIGQNRFREACKFLA